MASQPPPGYNPEASLLQGGTAPIMAVQGGGGMDAGASLPSGYNPNESLLNTGSSIPIVPVRGGGKDDPPKATNEKDIEDSSFTASITDDGSLEKSIEVNANTFQIRYPFAYGSKEADSKEHHPKNDWLKGKFTQNEVDFLHKLQFTPQLLLQTFGKSSWKKRLADFLEKLVLTDCYNSTTLLTSIECSNSQQFIKKIYFQMVYNSLEEIYDEMGIPKPKKLKDLILSLRELQGLIPQKGIFPITPLQFQGDLLGEDVSYTFHTETGMFTKDFAEIDPKAKEELSKLQFFRFQDADIAKVLQALESLKSKKIVSEPKKSMTKLVVNLEKVSSIPKEYYKATDLNVDSIPIENFDIKDVEPDGLCFYRAVLKATLPFPKSNTKTYYIPSREDTFSLIRNIKSYIKKNKAKMLSTLGTTVEQEFNNEFAPKEGIPPVIDTYDPKSADKRIRIDKKYYKMTYDDYINKMDAENDTERPFAEVDAGIGLAAAAVEDIVIVILMKKQDSPENYGVVGKFMKKEDETTPFPAQKMIFLEWVGGNHYNVLLLKPGKEWPRATAVKGGAVEEEEIFDLGEPEYFQEGGGDEEVFDLGDPISEKPRSRSRHKTRRHK